jgi:hypothetical protein
MTVSVVAQVAPGLEEIRIVLPPARAWRARILDETGQPIADGAVVLDNYRTEGQILDWTGRADATGLVVWENAPGSNVTLYARSPSLGLNRKIKMTRPLTEPEQVIVLSRKAAESISVKIQTIDATTGQPVRMQTLATRFDGGGSPFNALTPPEASEYSFKIKRTDFRVGMYPSFEIKVAADGYAGLTTEPFDFDAGDQTLVLPLRPVTGHEEITVLQPNGDPASKAKMWVQASPNDGLLHISGPGRYYGNNLTRAEADADGHVQLPSVPEEARVIISHSSGFVQTRMAQARQTGSVQLEPFGTVSGRLLVAGQPKLGVTLSLNTLVWSLANGFHLGLTATTDADGRFSFNQVPAGSYKLYRWALPQRRDTTGLSITETYQMPITVVAGQTNQVVYASSGRTVIGQATPRPTSALVNWLNDVHTLSLKLPRQIQAGGGRVNREDYASFAAFQKANTTATQSDAQQENARQARTYALQFEQDGTFRIDDVPPGTYELQIKVTKPDDAGSERRPAHMAGEALGSLVREVIIPPGQATFDLGLLPVELKNAGPPRPTPAVAFDARTLDGQPISLSQFKGTNVLLLFWAGWSERSREQMAELIKMRNELAPDARLAFVAASIDETIAAAREFGGAASWPGPQCWLDPAERARLTTAFGIDALPAVYLMDKNGQLVGRELEGDRIPTTIKRLLARK